MQTNFSLTQLADAAMAESERILRTCVHCGFCLATCPTYQILGDELDSPRGRIYQIKDMLERERPAPASVVKHIDRCLSCLSCMTTCPSGVHYMHLVDHARAYIEETHTRPFADRAIRTLLAVVLPRPSLFRLALIGAAIARPLRRFLPGRLGGMLDLAPRPLPSPSPVDRPGVHPAQGKRRGRVALLAGCAQQVVAPEINEATIRLLTRLGVEVVVARRAGCCGALVHHLGRTDESHEQARANILAWTRLDETDPIDAVIINTSGCGTTVKDYGFMFRNDAGLAEKADRIAGLARDVSEFLWQRELLPKGESKGIDVAYHSACSLQHGQKLRLEPKQLLQMVGFSVADPAEGHLCCGSAGTYNLLQPELAAALRDRKVKAIRATGAAVVAAGNVGCITQIQTGTDLPVLHTVELLDWATGGPVPNRLMPLLSKD